MHLKGTHAEKGVSEGGNLHNPTSVTFWKSGKGTAKATENRSVLSGVGVGADYKEAPGNPRSGRLFHRLFAMEDT